MARIVGSLAASILLLSSTLGWAQSDRVPVLIPVFFSGPGAFGSHWNTILTVANNSDLTLSSIPYVYECGIPQGCFNQMQPHVSRVWNASFTSYVTGFLINMPQDDVARVAFSLRVFDDHQAAIDHGTEMPSFRTLRFANRRSNYWTFPAIRSFASRSALTRYPRKRQRSPFGYIETLLRTGPGRSVPGCLFLKPSFRCRQHPVERCLVRPR
jgi:hypothetical protein